MVAVAVAVALGVTEEQGALDEYWHCRQCRDSGRGWSGGAGGHFGVAGGAGGAPGNAGFAGVNGALRNGGAGGAAGVAIDGDSFTTDIGGVGSILGSTKSIDRRTLWLCSVSILSCRMTTAT